MGSKIPKNEYGKIVDMYVNGFSQKEIGQQYNVSGTAIGYILKRNNVECKNRRYKLNLKDDISGIIRLRNSGSSLTEIADMFGVSSSRIGQILRNNGINTPNSRNLQFSYDEVLCMYNMYLSGVSRVDIAKKYNICADSIYNLFLKYDLKVKSLSHAKQRYKINENYFDKIDTPNKAYILGLLWADGCNMPEKHEIKISLQENDRHILESIKEELEFDKPLSFIDYTKKNSRYKNQYALVICNKHISERLNLLGMTKAKSLTLEWPQCIIPDLYRHFIRGYLDGDGCIYVGKGNSEVSFVGTIMFIQELRKILQENLGINLSIKTQKCYKDVTKIGTVHGNIQIHKILEWIYQDSDLKLTRKYEKYQQFLNSINNSCIA